MRNKFIFIVLVFASFFACGQQLLVATGTAKGTYSTELKEMIGVCGRDVAMVEVPSTGAVQNLDLLTLENKVNMAFVQSDLLYRRARTQDLGNIKTLLALHKEQLHFIARQGETVEVDSGAFYKPNSKYALTSVGQIGSLRVAAGGGSVETAKQFRTDSELNYKVVEAKDADDALRALNDKRADVALLVGGAPLGNVKALPAGYVLLSVPPAIVDKVKGAYHTDNKYGRLTYTNLGAQGVPTVFVDALLVTKEYKTEKMVNSLSRFRQCVLGKVDELKETTGTHPAWQSVDPTNHGAWNWYTLPTSK